MLTRFAMFNLLFACAISAQAEQRVTNIPAADFERLAALIKPQRGESPWRDIAWLTSVTEARKKAAAEGKPIVIFTAADGSPLGRA